MFLGPSDPPAKSCSKETNSVQYLAVCRNLNEGSQEQPSLKPSGSSPPALKRDLSTSLAIPNIDYHRTSNGITINIPKEGEAARFEAIVEESTKKERGKNEEPVELTDDNVVKGGGGRKRKTRKRRKKSKRKTRKNNLYKMKGGDNENKIKSPEDTFETNLNEFNDVVNRLYLEKINKNMLLQQQEQKKQMLREISKINLNIKEGTNREADLKKQMLQNHQELKDRINILAKSITYTSPHDKNAKKKRKSSKHKKPNNKKQNNFKRKKSKTKKKRKKKKNLNIKY